MRKPSLSLYSSVAWRHPFGLAKVCEWAQRFGYEALDIRGSSLHVPGSSDAVHLAAFGYDMLAPELVDAVGTRDLAQRVAAAGLSISGISCYAPLTLPPSPEQARCLDTVRSYLDLAATLRADAIRTIGHTTATVDWRLSLEDAVRYLIDALGSLAEDAEARGVRLLVETNENSVTESPAICLRILREVASASLGLVVDPTNLYFAGIDPYESTTALAHHTTVLHVKNVRLVTNNEFAYSPKGDRQFVWTSLREGDLDWPRLIRALTDRGFGGPIVYEYVNPFKGAHPLSWQTLFPGEESSRDASAFLRDILGT